MKKNFALRTVALSLGTVLGVGFFAGCGGKDQLPAYKANLVIMTEDLNGLFNPFYSTAGTDMDVVGQTQISMLSTDENGEIAYGNNEPTLVLDYKEESVTGTDGQTDTAYYFVLKNGMKFSDGSPVTMNDVLFNMYVYLDPSYTGSTTMYSTKILGLQSYRAQREGVADDGTQEDDSTSERASRYAANRILELTELFEDLLDTKNGKYSVSEAEMREKIASHTCTEAYLEAIGESDQEKAKEQLLADYDDSLKKFREELNSDYNSARNSYNDPPYDTVPVYYQGTKVSDGFNEIIAFLYHEGYTDMTDECYGKNENGGVDKTNIVKVELQWDPTKYASRDAVIDAVYNDKVPYEYDQILQYWATGTQMRTEFAAKAREIILHQQLGGDGLTVPNISGIVSLGHTTEETSVAIGDTTYTVARDHNDNGTPANAGEYDVLRITIDGVDPKAVWNFGFTVAPYYYYSDPNGQSETTKDKLENGDALTKALWSNVTEIDIKNNRFGVAWADFDFHQKILQGENTWGESKNKVPVGGGPYIATDEGNKDQPAATGFVSGNTVYYKSNPHFSLDGEKSSEPKIKHMHYEVTTVSNALSSLESGQVHFVSPQFTGSNIRKINDLKSRGAGSVDSWQLGYGYIGINAGEVKNINLRKAIMSALDASLALEYYETGTAVNIAFPMSAVSWAYPREAGYGYDGANPTAHMETNNDHSYTQFTTDDVAKEKIKSYMADAGNPSSSDLEIKFTIAGSNMYDHPAYLVFKKAMELLNDCGWKVSLTPDANALTKLATGSLAVWAAAWGSTIDPDMYQVYDKHSTATSTIAWGYDDILSDMNTYQTENGILNDLSDCIGSARETTDKKARTDYYRKAMGYVLDLAIEFPLYQRKVLYAYNLNVIKESSLPHKGNELAINPYTSPLSRIWEIEFTD